ncbi:MAG: hypothetical protein Q9220_003589 [cf. Caloplaca sp. 1 TL-2023]
MKTPKRYIYDSCTLAFAFLRDVGTFEDKPVGPYATQYSTSYHDLYSEAQALFIECVASQRKLGWFAPRSEVGYPVGLFFWATDSARDRRLPLFVESNLEVANQ